MMFQCPNCDEYSISRKDKIHIGPFHPVVCPECHVELSNSYLSHILNIFETFMFALVSVFVLTKFHNIMLFTVTSILILGISIFSNYKFVPLVVKEKNKDLKYFIRILMLVLLSIGVILASVFINLNGFTVADRDQFIDSFQEIIDLASELEANINTNGGMDHVDDQTLHELIVEMSNRISFIQRRMNFNSVMYDFLPVDINEGLSKLIDRYEEDKTYNASDRAYLLTYISDFKEADFLVNKTTYPLSWNPFADFIVPDQVKNFVENLDDGY